MIRERRRAWAAVGVAVAVVIGALALWLSPAGPGFGPNPNVPTREFEVKLGIDPGSTPQYPFAFLAAFDAAWSFPTPIPIPTEHPWYEPGRNFPLGVECNSYLGANDITGLPASGGVWETAPTGCSGDTCSSLNVDWDYIDNCLAAASTYTVTLRHTEVISMPVAIQLPPLWLDAGGSGTPADPYQREYFPTWMQTAGWLDTFTYDGDTYWGPAYDDATLVDRLEQFISEAGTRYASNDQIALVRIGTGFQAETQPVKRLGVSDTALRAAFEASGVTCAEYRSFIAALGDAAAAAFPNKSVVVMPGPGPCASAPYEAGHKWRTYLYTDSAGNAGWAAEGTPVGSSMNAMEPDRADADEWDGNTLYRDWRLFRTGKTLDAYGAPVAWEYYANPTGNASWEDDWQYDYWTALAAAGHKGDYLLPFTTWSGYHTWDYWDVVWYKLGDLNTHAYTILRDAEYPTYNWAANYGVSGAVGNYEQNLRVLTPTLNPQYCSQEVVNAAATAVYGLSSSNTIYYRPCGLPATPGASTPFVLPTPRATLQTTPSADAAGDFNMLQRLRDRQARAVARWNGRLFAEAEDNWPYEGTVQDVLVKVSYLDIGSEPFYVNTEVETTTITRGNTGLWQEASWQWDDLDLSNGLVTGLGNAFLAVLNNGPDLLYIGDITVDVLLPTPTPTTGATATATNTLPPTPTSTPTATATPTGSPTPTPTVTLTPEVLITPSITPTPTRTLTATPATTNTPTSTPTAITTVQVCPAVAVTVDATLSEWGSATPVVLDATTAERVFPATPTPAAADAYAEFRCGYDSDYLYVSGVITDSAVLTPTGSLAIGDAVVLGLDGWADGALRIGLDDHILFVGPDGKARDYDVYPVGGSVATARHAGGWQFEAALPAALLELAQFSPGRQIGVTWEYVDRDTGTAFDHVLTLARRALRME